MKTAIIPPGRLAYPYGLRGDRYHLTLCHLIPSLASYTEFYRRRSHQGDYIILDNSAHEMGVGNGIERLIEAAHEISASEVVLPDRLFIGDDTLEQAVEALPILREKLPKVKVMGVPQGRTIQEWEDCLHGLVSIGVDTIGISKDYEVWPGGLRDRVHEAVMAGNQEIHLLGWGRRLNALYELAREYGERLRGVDSAKPLVYASHGLFLPIDPHEVPPMYPRRKDDFFGLRTLPVMATSWNIQVFRAWAHGKTEIELDRLLGSLGVSEYEADYKTREVTLPPDWAKSFSSIPVNTGWRWKAA